MIDGLLQGFGDFEVVAVQLIEGWVGLALELEQLVEFAHDDDRKDEPGNHDRADDADQERVDERISSVDCLGGEDCDR